MPPTAGDSRATPSACPQFLPVGQPHRGVKNSQGVGAWSGGRSGGEGGGRSRRTPVPKPAPNKGLQLTAYSLRSVRREAVWKNVVTPLGIQVPIEPLELSTLDHSRV